MTASAPHFASAESDDPCWPHKPLTYGFEDLIIQARVYGPVDRRGELSKIEKTLILNGQKLSKAESDQIRGAVGGIFCKAYGNFESVALSASLIGSNREITTTSHGLVDDWGTKRDLSTCYFENFEIPPKRVALLPNSPRNIISNQPMANSRRDDRARVELAKPLENVKPFAPDYSGKKLAKGTPIVALAAQHRDFKSSGVDPILSLCSVKDFYDLGDGLSRIKEDCDADKGGSGGVILSRGDDGKLYAKAVLTSASYPSELPNHSPYSESSNYGSALVIDQSFLNWYSK